MSKAWVYILRCSDKSYYTGSTTNLEKRLDEHRNGEGSEWTKKRLPVELVFFQEMPDKDQAYLAEQHCVKRKRNNIGRESLILDFCIHVKAHIDYVRDLRLKSREKTASPY
jgi:putative endonuclease